jgi:uncharacterized protein (UPF0332 family)
MNGRDFLDTARYLVARGGESDGRSGASRAYYSAFHAARDLLTALRFRTPRADRAHNYLYVRLNNCGDARIQYAAFLLNKLRGLRNEADYDVHQPFKLTDANKTIADADRILQALDGLTPTDHIQITSAMKLYEQGIGDVTWRP